MLSGINLQRTYTKFFDTKTSENLQKPRPVFRGFQKKWFSELFCVSVRAQESSENQPLKTSFCGGETFLRGLRKISYNFDTPKRSGFQRFSEVFPGRFVCRKFSYMFAVMDNCVYLFLKFELAGRGGQRCM